MPKEATMPMPQPPEEDEDEKDEEGEDGEKEEDDDDAEEAAPVRLAASQAEQAVQSGEGREAGAEAKIVPKPEQTQIALLEKANGLVARLEAVIGKLKGTKLIEGKKILAEAREHKKELKIKLAKIRKGAEYADFSEVIHQAEAVEKRAAKLTAEFAVGEMVAWKNDKGEELHGEVIGLGEAEGVVIVKTEKNPKGFAVSKNKLEKMSVSPDHAAALIGAATDFDSLIAAVEQVGALRGSDGKVYPKEKLVQVVTAIRDNPDVTAKSPILVGVTRAGGFRDKLMELMRPRDMGNLREDYTKKNAVLTKNYSGITGWMKRVIDRGGYKKATEERNESYERYAGERAELVLQNIDKMITEEIALADSQADAFQKEKGWGSKLYDRYKKLGKVRMIISAGLVGGGFLLSGGAPAFVLAGMMGVRRVVGGTGVAVGSYDIMNKQAEKNKPKFDLTPEQQVELDKFENEKGVQWYNREIKIFGKPSEKGQKWQQQRQVLDAKRAGFEKVQAEQKAPEMSDAELQKAITYFEAVTVWNGKKPSQDSTYMILMAEKAKRYKKALKAVDAPDAKPADKRPFEEQLVERRKEKTVEAMVTVIDSLKQRYLVDQKLFEQMRAVKGTPEQRKQSPEYAAWIAGRKKLAEIDAKLPPDIQVFLQKYCEGKKHPSMAMLTPKLAGEWKSFKPETIDEVKVWETEWTLQPELQAELNELLDKNALLNKEAEDEVREAMTATVETVETEKAKVDKVKTAVLGFLDEEMRKQDAAVEKRRRLAVYADAAMKAAAAAIGVVIGLGVIQEWIRSQFATDVVHDPVPKPEPVKPTVAHVDPVEPVRPTVVPVEPVEPVKPTVVPTETPHPEVAHVPKWDPNIREMQKLLDTAEYSPGGFDGVQGKLTTAAIKAFQLDHGMPVTGRASKAFMTALRAAAEEKANTAAEVASNAAAEVPVEAPVEAPTEAPMPAADAIPKTGYSSGFADHVVFSDGTELVIDSKLDAIGALTRMGVSEESLRAIAKAPVIGGKMMDIATNGGVIKVPTSEYFKLAAKSLLYDGEVPGAGAVGETAAAATEQASDVPADVDVAVPTETVGTESPAESVPMEPRADVSGTGSIEESAGEGVTTRTVSSYYEGTTSGVGQRELVESGILKGNWSKYLRKGLTASLAQTSVLDQARHIYGMQQALENAQAAGDSVAAEAIASNLKTSVQMAERAYGDVFKL